MECFSMNLSFRNLQRIQMQFCKQKREKRYKKKIKKRGGKQGVKNV